MTHTTPFHRPDAAARTFVRPETWAVIERVTIALDALAAGRMIVVVDDFDRENEGDLLIASEHATAEAIDLMSREGRGLICQTITDDQAARLDLAPQSLTNTALHGTAFTVSVDAARGVTSGVSAKDRAHTIRLIADAATRPGDLVRPGHVFPITAVTGGVFARRGHTETGCDLARLAGCAPSAVICEILGDDGDMARGEAVTSIAERIGAPLVSVDDVARYRSLVGDVAVRHVATVHMPTTQGAFQAAMFESEDPGCPELIAISSIALGADGLPVNALSRAPHDTDVRPAPLVRLHSACMTGEALGSLRCDCGPQLDAALAAIGREPGIVLYLQQEGRSIGLADKFRAYAAQDAGADTVDANRLIGHRDDERHYAAATAVLRHLGVERVRLMTNNPEKVEAVACAGITPERIAHDVGAGASNARYLATKARRMGHLLPSRIAG